MITIRRSSDRGHVDHGWLDTRHTFSFAGYHDPRHMGFRALRVVNEDRVRPGEGFPSHGHRDMEILSYVLEGALEHRDSMGHGSVIRPGELQRMSAGTGVIHSEANASKIDPVHFLQIWIRPDREGIEPGYEQREFSEEDRRGRLKLLAGPDGSGDSLRLHQDVRLYGTLLAPGERVSHRLEPGRHAWIQVASGAVRVNGEALAAGDGAAVSDEDAVAIEATEGAEVLLFDLS